MDRIASFLATQRHHLLEAVDGSRCGRSVGRSIGYFLAVMDLEAGELAASIPEESRAPLWNGLRSLVVEFGGELTSHQRIRFAAELRQLEGPR